MSTSNILFLKIGFGEAAGTVSPKHRPAEGIRAWRCGDSSFCPSLATVQDCLNISAAVNQIHTEPPRSKTWACVCRPGKRKSWRHWFAPANRTKESKITFSGGCFKGGRDETLPSCERNKNWFISYVLIFSRHTFPPWCKHSLTACCYKCVLRRLKQLLYVE